MELWKDVKGFEDAYEISSLGRLRSKSRRVSCKGGKTRSVKGAIRKYSVNHRGYALYVLSKPEGLTGITAHQLVAQAFLPNFQRGTELNHIDGNKLNNSVSNLELSNPSHNQFHAIRNGLKPKVGKSQYHNVSYIKNPRAKAKWAASINHEGKSSFGWKTFMTEIEAAHYVDELLDSIGDTQRLRNFPKCPTTIPEGSRVK